MGIIYSVTNRSYSLLRGIIMLFTGILLIWKPVFALNFIVQLIAVLLVASGIVTLVLAIGNRKKSGRRDLLSSFAEINTLVYVSFGVLIFIFPGFFISALVFLFGVILLLLGGSQIANIVLSSRYGFKAPVLLYVVPAIITICGIILFFQPFTSRVVLTMFFGGCVAAYGIMELASSWKFRKVKFDKSGRFVETEEVPYEDVKSEQPDGGKNNE
ncbi:MAG: DUF308 domain-containing protein [Bacteroidales bacterium]|jgi:uncharacterized membrane protein HdeD (DUF308 family)|nr:DUF308 domain-containing protein [Bacteroidales bacterium]